jgi:putative addiction module component (TIGR02574 family)
MTQQAATLLSQALRLSESERGDLAVQLIDSLDPLTDAEAESAWGVEIQKRIEELRSGRVKPLTWPEARRMIVETTDGSNPA